MASRTNHSISTFKSKLIGGGARPNLFEVNLDDVPGTVQETWKDFKFLCKAANLPAQNIASIDVPFRGRQFKVAGDRTIDNWTVTIINDEDFKYRAAFEAWSQRILSNESNMGVTNPDAYMRDAMVLQLGRSDKIGKEQDRNAFVGDSSKVPVLYSYQFTNIWPVTVGDIALSMETGDTIEEYDVEFAVNSFRMNEVGYTVGNAN